MRLSTSIHAASGRPTRRNSARPGFTLVELLVVIGIIGLLIGLLLPALGKVIQRAKSTQTLGTMQEFSKACDAYFQEFGEYPAAIPDEALYAGVTGAGSTGGSDSVPPAVGQMPRITAMENALLALMGGYRVPTDADYATFGQTSTPPAVELTFNTTPVFRIKVDSTKMGEGPYKNGRKYEAFYAPKGREFGKAFGQIDATTASVEVEGGRLLPDLIDAWGAPIAFIKQQRGIGPLVRNGNRPGQFERAGMIAYVGSIQLGDTSIDQTESSKKSVLNTNGLPGTSPAQSGAAARDLTLGQLIRHAGLSTQSSTGGAVVPDADKVWSGTARGKYFLFSAGPDGYFFSRTQTGSTTTTGEPDIVGSGLNYNPDGPRILEKFDDIVVSGGS